MKLLELKGITAGYGAGPVLKSLDIDVDEGEIVTRIQQAAKNAQGLLINAGAYSHTSIAIFDALSALSIPIIEIHLSNIFRREPFRHESYVSKAATGVICGFGGDSYLLALEGLVRRLAARPRAK